MGNVSKAVTRIYKEWTSDHCAACNVTGVHPPNSQCRFSHNNVRENYLDQRPWETVYN